MRRFGFVLPVAALVLAACQDTQQPPASFQLADGRNWEPAANWNKHFFFLTPIAPTPTTFNGPFDPAAGPHLRAWITGPWPVTVDPTSGKPDALTANCSDSQFYTLPAPAGSGEAYATSWHPSKDSGVEPTPDNSLAYRICVSYQAASIEIVLGWRDVLPDDGGSNQPRNTEQDPIYQFGSNGNLPIKFRVEEGILDDEFCQFDVLTGGELYDCTARVLATDGTATCQNNTCELTAGGLLAPELFVVEKFGPGSTECDAPNTTGWLNTDIPEYAGCVRVTVPNTAFEGFTDEGGLRGYGTVGACFYPGSGPGLVGVDQDESIQMHVQYPLEDGQERETVWALPWGAVETEVFAECQQAFPEDDNQGTAAGALRQLWNYASRVVMPKKAWAFHTGFGGHTSLRGTEDGTAPPDEGLLIDEAGLVASEDVAGPMVNQNGDLVFKFAWALPSAFTDPALTVNGDPAPPGQIPVITTTDAVAVSVLVQDNGARYLSAGRELQTPRPVWGADVHFLTAAGENPTNADFSEQSVDPTGGDGLASFATMFATAGYHTIRAQGFGIGTAKPFDSFDVNGDYTGYSALLGYGWRDVTVFVCDNAATGFWDGDIANTTGATEHKFPVNLGGKVTADAYLYVGNDCDNFYIAFAVPVDETTNNSVRFVFDNTFGGADIGQGVESADDDILSVNKTELGWMFRDRHLSQNCLGSKQADCGPDDTSAGGDRDGDGDAAWNGALTLGARTGYFVYTMRHPLKSGDTSFDFQRTFGESFGFYLAISLGTGTKGNTEWPSQNNRFKTYQPYVVSGPVLTP